MLYIEINGTERTEDIEEGKIKIVNQIQQKSDTLSFTVLQGSKPSENQDVRFFRVATIASAVGGTINLNTDYQTSTNFFYAGQKLKIRVGDSDEENVEVSSYDEASAQIILTGVPSGTVSAGDKIGPIMFGGVISRVKDRNVQVLQNIEYDIEGVDYTKIFDKKLISDTWENVDSRYIINSFVNSTVNLNRTIDVIDYDDNAAIQAAWANLNDGDSPTVDSSDFLEGDASGVFPWTNSSGAASWRLTPSAINISDLVNATSGIPTEGHLMFWLKADDYTTIDGITITIGSDTSNFLLAQFDAPTDNDWHYYSVQLADQPISGTPDWTAVDLIQFNVLNNASSSVKINGFRINAEKSFTLYNVESTPVFDDLRSPQIKPTSLMQLLADAWEYAWYIDYDRDIHFKAISADPAPFNIDDTSANFSSLKVDVDASQIGNRIIVGGGERISESSYSEPKEGDGTRREWVLRNKFKNLVILIDDGGTTDTMEGSTTTTNVNATAHGLSVGDHVVMRSRNNVVREVLTVPDPNNFTVKAVTGQTSGDTFSLFAVAKTNGVDGLVDETTVDYLQNSNAQSVRATTSESTLNTGEFIKFTYNERIPIEIQYSDTASANALKALGYGDGIFDLAPEIDENITDVGTALAVAQAKINKYSNAVITGSFITEQNGLKAGQIIRITETINRNIDDDFLIQSVKARQSGGEYFDNFVYEVTFGSTIFGYIEFFQKLLASTSKIGVNTDSIVSTFVNANEDIEFADTNQVATDGGFKGSSSSEDIEFADTNTVDTLTSGTWRFEPNGVGQTFESRFDLCDFG